MLPDDSRFKLNADVTLCRLLNGMWQVSGAHGPINAARALPDMLAYHDAGFTTWDLADHYGPAEDFIGRFRQSLRERDGEAALNQMQAFTKWVPRPGPMTRSIVEAAMNLSRRRMQSETLDMLQFHWWDYGDRRYLDALKHMMDLQSAGQIRILGLTNFDTDHLSLIRAAGVPILTNQVQYSLVDRRPEVAMLPYCRENGVYLLSYGTLCGGFLSDRYLDHPEPATVTLRTASQRKYKNMIDAWGGWALFQRLLGVLRIIANKYRVGIANVGTRFILEQAGVAGVIVGARLGEAQHRKNNARVFNFALDDEDRARIEAISAEANDLYRIIGDCGAEYRRR